MQETSIVRTESTFYSLEAFMLHSGVWVVASVVQAPDNCLLFVNSTKF